ncbi:MAG TPA: hypothetical protein VGM56_18490 [Byssovorax sp.]|jgi:hypothetical protein
MFKELVLAVAVASMSASAVGCAAKDPNTAEDAKSDQSPVDELRGLSDDLGKDVDGIMQPINDVDDVVNQLTEAPKKYGLDASDVKAMGKAAFDGGEIKLSANVKPEQRDELMALMTKIKGIPVGLNATPDKVSALVAKLPAALAKVPVLYGKAQASLQVKANNPFGNADEKAKAKADLAGLDKVKTDTMTKVDTIKTSVTALPEKATKALAKLKTALG